MLIVLLLLLPSFFVSASTERNRDQFIRYKMLMREWSVATLRDDSLGLIGFFDRDTRRPTQTNISLTEFYRNAEMRDCSNRSNSLSRAPKFTRLLRFDDLLLMLESQRGDVMIFDPVTVHAIVLRFVTRVLDFAVVEDPVDRLPVIYFLARTNRVLNTVKSIKFGSSLRDVQCNAIPKNIYNVFATSPRDGRIYVDERANIYAMSKVASKLFVIVLPPDRSLSRSHVLQPVSSHCHVGHFSVSSDRVLLINLRCPRDNRTEFYYAKPRDDLYWLSPAQKEIASSLFVSILANRQSLGLHLSQSGNLFVQSLLHPAYLAASSSSTDRSVITRSVDSFSLANQLEFCQVALNTPVPVANNLGSSINVVDMVVRFDLLMNQFPSYLSVCAGGRIGDVPNGSTVPTPPAVDIEQIIYGMVRNFTLVRPNLLTVPLLADGNRTTLLSRVNASLQEYNLYTYRQDRLIRRLQIALACVACLSLLLVLIIFVACLLLRKSNASTRSSLLSFDESGIPLDGLYRRYPDPEQELT